MAVTNFAATSKRGSNYQAQLMSHPTNRNQARHGESPDRSFKRFSSGTNFEKRARPFHDDGDDFQGSSKSPPKVTSAKTKRPREHSDLSNYGSRLQLSKSHEDLQKVAHIEREYKPAVPKNQLLRLPSSTKSAKDSLLSKTPMSGRNVRALSYLKKRPSSLLAGVSREQHQDLFAASITAKTKPVNLFAITSTSSIRPDVLNLPKPRKNRRKQETEATKSTDEIKASMPTVSALDHKTDGSTMAVIKCPYCHQVLDQPLSKSLEKALSKAMASLKSDQDTLDVTNSTSATSNAGEAQSVTSHSMQLLIRPRASNRSQASNRERFLFCTMHKTEQVMIPEGIKKGYYIDIDFGDVEKRVSEFIDELEDIINGKVESIYRKNALAAYDKFGKRKARSTLKILDRFESTLPGYYGAEGSHRIMKVLTIQLIKTEKLTPAKSEPQEPVEYLQQVLVPECGRRLIAQDIKAGRTTAPKNTEGDVLSTAASIMQESAEFGNMVHPYPDDIVEGDRTEESTPAEEQSKFSHFFDEQSDNEEDGERDDADASIFSDDSDLHNYE